MEMSLRKESLFGSLTITDVVLQERNLFSLWSSELHLLEY